MRAWPNLLQPTRLRGGTSIFKCGTVLLLEGVFDASRSSTPVWLRVAAADRVVKVDRSPRNHQG
jgi:hypothetical protein